MADYKYLPINKVNQVWESELLHLISLRLDFAHEIIHLTGQQNKSDFVLFDHPSKEDSLFNLMQTEDYKITHNPIKKSFFIELLILLTNNLLRLHELLFKANLDLINPELITCYHDSFELKKIKWLVLPSNYRGETPPLTEYREENNLWHFIANRESWLSDLYLNHYELITKGYFKDALQLLYDENHTPNANIHLPNQKNQKIKDDNLSNTSNKNKKNSLISRIQKKLHNSISNKTLPGETTVPLNPQDELFRLAMISESPSGTPAENEGLRAFILVDEFLIGRDRMVCDLVLTEDTIGRIHARISRHGSHYFLEDLGSANGTALDGKKLNKRQTYLLPDQCRLKFAELTFYFHIEA